jgi:triosephosphate isomerase
MVEKIIVAYEPVWAVGVKATRQATPEDVLEMALYIRKILVDTFGEKQGSGIPILYGGSVDAKNAFSYLNGCEVQGLLVGRVSLKPGVFEKILNIANG